MAHSQRTVLGIGELLWDCFPDGRRPGGAPANVAFHAGQLGLEGIVCSRVGADPLGDEIVQFLASQDLATDHIQRDVTFPTGTVAVSFADGADHPEFVIHEDVAWDHFEFDERLHDAAGHADAICFGSLAQRSPVSRGAIHAVLQAAPSNCLKVFDVNLRQHFYSRDVIAMSLHACDVLKLNENEVAILSPLLEIGARSVDDFATAILREFTMRAVCVTAGARGCQVFDSGRRSFIASEPVETVDAVGAGDAFTAGLIFGLLEGRDIVAAGRFANRMGGLVASRPGAMPVIRDEIVRIGNRDQGTGTR